MNSICNHVEALPEIATEAEVGTQGYAGNAQPWYFVRPGLLMSLVTLVTLLATLLSYPELIDYVQASVL